MLCSKSTMSSSCLYGWHSNIFQLVNKIFYLIIGIPFVFMDFLNDTIRVEEVVHNLNPLH